MSEEQNRNNSETRNLGGGWSIKEPAAELDREDETRKTVSGEDTADRSQVPSASLVVMGVFGGLYLLYAWGWFEVAKAYSVLNEQSAQSGGIIGAFLQVLLFWLAPISPAVWFLTAVSVGGLKSAGKLFLTLGLGAVILLPFPLVLAGVGVQ